MEIIENTNETEPVGREMTRWGLFFSRLNGWWYRNVSRRLPRLVWVGDEIDVRVTFSQDPMNQDDPIQGLYSGGLYEIEKQLSQMGVSFDRGQGCGGRDWEWDWSLDGPISVAFHSRAKRPERRKAKERPTLTAVA